MPPGLTLCGDDAMHIRIPVGSQCGLNLDWNIKNQSVCDPEKGRLIFFPPLQQLNRVFIFDKSCWGV